MELAEQKLYQISIDITTAKRNLAQNYLMLGELLSTVRREKLYMVGDFDTFDAYLADPTISMSYATASRLINCYEIFVEHYKLDADELKLIDFSKVAELLPVVKNLDKPVEEVTDLLKKANDMTIRDLRIYKKGLEGIDVENCQHEWAKREHWTCSKCGDRVYNDPLATTQ